MNEQNSEMEANIEGFSDGDIYDRDVSQINIAGQIESDDNDSYQPFAANAEPEFLKPNFKMQRIVDAFKSTQFQNQSLKCRQRTKSVQIGCLAIQNDIYLAVQTDIEREKSQDPQS